MAAPRERSQLAAVLTSRGAAGVASPGGATRMSPSEEAATPGDGGTGTAHTVRSRRRRADA